MYREVRVQSLGSLLISHGRGYDSAKLSGLEMVLMKWSDIHLQNNLVIILHTGVKLVQQIKSSPRIICGWYSLRNVQVLVENKYHMQWRIM